MDSKKHGRKDKKHRKKRREDRSRSRSLSESSGDDHRKNRTVKSNAVDDAVTQSSSKGGGDEKSLSIEETNKLRAMLGLKPLEVPGASNSSTATPSKKESKEVFVLTRNVTQDKETERVREKLELVKEKRRVAENITSKPLADDDAVDDISAWVQRSRDKELAKQREKLMAETDALVAADTEVETSKPKYSGRDLAGLRVEHSLERIKDERPVILTLKDRKILGDGEDDGDEGDVLENVNLVDEERAERHLADKKAAEQVSGYGVVRYRPYDDDGVDGAEGTSLLNKYDEEIFGRKKKFFVLSGSKNDDEDEGLAPNHRSKTEPKLEPDDSTISRSQSQMEVDMNPLEQLRAKLLVPTRPNINARPISLATTALTGSGPVLASEYYTPEEMATKFKKVRKVRKPMRTLKADDLLPIENEPGEASSAPMDEDVKPLIAETAKGALKFEPVDAELEATLGRTKKLREIAGEGEANGSRLKRRLPEQVAVDLLAQTTLNPAVTAVQIVPDGSITLNLTSEFCRGVGDLPTITENRPEVTASNGKAATAKSEDAMQVEGEEETDVRRKPSARNYRKQDDSDEETARLRRKNSGTRDHRGGGEESENSESEDEFVLGHEPKAASSVAEALRLASMKGYLDKASEDKSGGGTTVVGGKVSQYAAKNFTVEERNHGDIDAKFNGNRNRGGPRERGSGGPLVEFCEKSDYHPDAKIEYNDAAGKAVDQKEAFRLLSHRFHGKGSGKKKIEKRIRKEAQERKIMSQSSSDTPLGTLNRLVQRQQKEKQAFVVLSSAGTAASVSIPMSSDSPAKSKPKVKKPAAGGANTSVKPQ